MTVPAIVTVLSNRLFSLTFLPASFLSNRGVSDASSIFVSRLGSVPKVSIQAFSSKVPTYR